MLAIKTADHCCVAVAHAYWMKEQRMYDRCEQRQRQSYASEAGGWLFMSDRPAGRWRLLIFISAKHHSAPDQIKVLISPMMLTARPLRRAESCCSAIVCMLRVSASRTSSLGLSAANCSWSAVCRCAASLASLHTQTLAYNARASRSFLIAM